MRLKRLLAKGLKIVAPIVVQLAAAELEKQLKKKKRLPEE